MNHDTINLILEIILGLLIAHNTWVAKRNQVNIQKIETATNSMKDALVKAAGELGEAKGKEAGIAQQKRESL